MPEGLIVGDKRCADRQRLRRDQCVHAPKRGARRLERCAQRAAADRGLAVGILLGYLTATILGVLL
jgi:hypothetical protein